MSIKNKVTFVNENLSENHLAKAQKIENLRKLIERDFYADVNIHCNYSPVTNTWKLVINMQCNFTLIDSFTYLNNGGWGGFQYSYANGNLVSTSSFQEYFKELNSKSDAIYDIEELSITMLDTSIIIGKVYNLSILDNIGKIFDALNGNFVHFTKGISEMPYEIFLPVYEESQETNLNHNNNPQNADVYYNYWGLYFDSDTQMFVYDCKSKTLIEGDFFLL
ncbi:hypothetical protein GCM10011414_15430 [Croceivirga lutea]|uniref:hypothetical protein n=1 Tax=Croceivirga lutea TaxID=1775167 RepID=UPI00163A88EA|nr:hypothetical protein [Croceivirga lutea]GGG46682.1 hypothetical protein GCM10011414_15430 [Croceivirga lutea]